MTVAGVECLTAAAVGQIAGPGQVMTTLPRVAGMAGMQLRYDYGIDYGKNIGYESRSKKNPCAGMRAGMKKTPLFDIVNREMTRVAGASASVERNRVRGNALGSGRGRGRARASCTSAPDPGPAGGGDS
jgi:hypothetical protein